MDGISIGDLTKILGGTLQLGPMPPLAGLLEPVRRIVPRCEDVKPGDVLLAVPSAECSTKSCQHNQFLEEAYARGALGVIAQRTVAPWAGTFALKVDDCQNALWGLAAWNRHRYCGQLIAIVTHEGPQLAADMVLTGLYGGTPEPMSSQRPANPLWQLADLRNNRPVDVIQTDFKNFSAIAMDACQPDLVLVASLGRSESEDQQLTCLDHVDGSWLKSLDENCQVVCSKSDHALKQQLNARQVPFQTFRLDHRTAPAEATNGGDGPNSESYTGTVTDIQSWRCKLLVLEQELELTGPPENTAVAATAALVTLRLAGADVSLAAKRIRRQMWQPKAVALRASA